jgi:hypothetical protein
MTTSQLTNPAKDAGQVIGYSHLTKLANNANQVIGYTLANTVFKMGSKSSFTSCKLRFIAHISFVLAALATFLTSCLKTSVQVAGASYADILAKFLL